MSSTLLGSKGSCFLSSFLSSTLLGSKGSCFLSSFLFSTLLVSKGSLFPFFFYVQYIIAVQRFIVSFLLLCSVHYCCPKVLCFLSSFMSSTLLLSKGALFPFFFYVQYIIAVQRYIVSFLLLRPVHYCCPKVHCFLSYFVFSALLLSKGTLFPFFFEMSIQYMVV